MAIGIFGSGVSALNAAQIGLATAEHNISNANTPGFNRQQAVQTTRFPEATGVGFIGQGTDVITIKRIYNEFLTGQVLHEQAQASQLNTYYSQIKQIDSMLADQSVGLSSAIQDFFGAVNNVANAPESQAARQSMLSNAQYMVSRFHSLNQRLIDINDNINKQISSSVTTINSYAKQIATINQNIAVAQASFNGQPPNDLLDQRDYLISQLNQEIQASVVKQSDGSYNIFIGNGQSLVVGAEAFSLQAVQSLSDPANLEVAYGASGSTIVRLQQTSLQGGNLGGLLSFRTQSLNVTQNALGRLAMGMADTFNQQHQLGQDLNGVLGGNFFVQPVPVVINNGANLGTATVGVSVSDYAALTGSDYSLKFNGGTAYTLTRLSDNTVTALSSLPQTVDGLAITTTAGALAGDSYLIRPTVNGASDIAVAITDPSRIAAAAPIRTNAPLTNAGTGKIDAGSVNPPPSATPNPAHPLTDLNLQQPVTLTFNNPPATYSLTSSNATIAGGTTVTVASTANMVVGAPVTGGGFPAGTTIASITNGTTFVTSAAAVPAAATGQTLQVGNYPYIPGGLTLNNATITSPLTVSVASTAGMVVGAPISGGGFPSGTTVVSFTGTTFVASAASISTVPATGQTLQIGNTFNGWTAQISGTPAAGDIFTVGSNTNATTDSRNALLMAGLQTQNTLAGGTATYQGAYSQLVSLVGNKTRELEVTSTAQTNMVNQIIQAQQSISGVNLDEEAADLLRYQRAYQAAGKAIQIANTMFDTLLSLGK